MLFFSANQLNESAKSKGLDEPMVLVELSIPRP